MNKSRVIASSLVALATAGVGVTGLAGQSSAATAKPTVTVFSQAPQTVGVNGGNVKVVAGLARAQKCQLQMVSGQVSPQPLWSHNPKACTTSDTQTIHIWKATHSQQLTVAFKLVVMGKGGQVSHTFHLYLKGTGLPTTTTTTSTSTTSTTLPACTTTSSSTTSTTSTTVSGGTTTTSTTLPGTTTTTVPTTTTSTAPCVPSTTTSSSTTPSSSTTTTA